MLHTNFDDLLDALTDQAYASDYRRTLQTLDDMSTLLPGGWQEVYSDMLKKLWVADHPSRKNLRFENLRIDDGVLKIDISETNKVVAGIIRKASQKMAHTCTDCGAPGKLRLIGLSQKSLCPSCYAPLKLRSDLKIFLENLENEESVQKEVLTEQDVPFRVRMALCSAAWTNLEVPTKNVTLRCITVSAMRNEIPRLKSLKTMLDGWRVSGNFELSKPNASEDD